MSASNQLGGHLSERRYVYTFPFVRQSRWIIVDINDPTYRDPAGFTRYLRKHESKSTWRIAFSSDGITVLHKRLDGGREGG